MGHIPDDLYLGGFEGGSQAMDVQLTGGKNPTSQIGVGPMGRIIFMNIVPLTANTTNIAAAQHQVAATPLTLGAGTGTTLGTAPDGSGLPVILFDVARAVSLTSTSNLSATNFTLTGYNNLGQKQTQTLAGPNNNTVNTTKTFVSILSVVPNTTNAGANVSVGSADIFGLSFCLLHLEYVVSVKWNGVLADDAGTAVVADQTSPATASTGDTRGTYAPSSASNGTKRLTMGYHMDGTSCGAAGMAQTVNAIGVTPV